VPTSWGSFAFHPIGKFGAALVVGQAKIVAFDHQLSFGGNTRPPSMIRPTMGSDSIGTRL
jgi:hypothetical protein